MADTDDFKIKGAATAAAQMGEAEDVKEVPSSREPEPQQDHPDPPELRTREEAEAKTDDAGSDEEGVVSEEHQKANQLKRYRWCKCFGDPAQLGGYGHYFTHMDTHQSRWEEPGQPYWIWDAEKQDVHESGLQQPSVLAQQSSREFDPNYSGYNPKIHGSYDPNADYAQYHNKKREEEVVGQHVPSSSLVTSPEYSAAGAFNRVTGTFQNADRSSERHNDYNKSGRQMAAFFDVDAAANAHNGKSLKEERRNEKLSRKQVKELQEKRKAKKEKKRMDFYKS